MEHEMKLLVRKALLRILHDVILPILTNTRQLHDENGLVLVLLIEQFLPLPYISVLRLVELIVYDRIEMMLTLDQQTLNKQLLPEYLPLIL
ncbi:unnamed protein product [Rotaria sp. Silwood1]|nr:unnamed protein product [Rotaria sp. Silwood1]CAF1685372.1 unnamed protein product [Rotaria sp. Silwood1]